MREVGALDFWAVCRKPNISTRLRVAQNMCSVSKEGLSETRIGRMPPVMHNVELHGPAYFLRR